MKTKLSIKKNFQFSDKNEEGSLVPQAANNSTPVIIEPAIARNIAKAISAFICNLPKDDFSVSARTAFDAKADPVKKQTALPKVIEHLPGTPQHGAVMWEKIGDLPGYAVSEIRKMGRDIFSSFPCFEDFKEICAEKGCDALSEVMVASDLTHNQSMINYLAKIIANKGQFASAGEIDHGHAIPGYQPKIAVFMTEDWTFKLVQDRPEFGAPISLNSIYAWPGGLKAYRDKFLERPTQTILQLQRLDNK